jgi:hypothetical protein
MEAIENAIEESGLDIDYEISAGILTLMFENKSKIILSRQGFRSHEWIHLIRKQDLPFFRPAHWRIDSTAGLTFLHDCYRSIRLFSHRLS